MTLDPDDDLPTDVVTLSESVREDLHADPEALNTAALVAATARLERLRGVYLVYRSLNEADRRATADREGLVTRLREAARALRGEPPATGDADEFALLYRQTREVADGLDEHADVFTEALAERVDDTDPSRGFH